MARPRRAIPPDGAAGDVRQLLAQALRFGLVGLINTAIGLAAIDGLIYFFDAGPAFANAVGYAIGFAVSFVLNRLWTFVDKRSVAKVLPRYLAVAAVSYVLNLAVVLVTSRHFGVGPYLVQFFGMGVYTGTMFVGCRWLVFRAPNPQYALKP